nr:ATP-binding protein [Streptomyces sp. NBC_00151]
MKSTQSEDGAERCLALHGEGAQAPAWAPSPPAPWARPQPFVPNSRLVGHERFTGCSISRGRLFQIFTEREECKATAVATNSPFAEWDKTFGDPRLCAAIADRITFRCTLIQTGTDSYRYQATQDERQSKKR